MMERGGVMITGAARSPDGRPRWHQLMARSAIGSPMVGMHPLPGSRPELLDVGGG